uniref:JmjC domain-containing protein n=1 Tax=Haptolina brevifila TaxID=156173 RepID=A0A7S2IV02_9EUKA
MACLRTPSYFVRDYVRSLEKAAHMQGTRQWLVVGGARSGSRFHVDPVATSAWNLCLQGRKLWALYPPGAPPPGVRVHPPAEASASSIGFEAPPAAEWFDDVRPWLDAQSAPRYEVVQEAGELVFVPAGWWHCVLNLEETVAFTQNVITEGNIAASIGAFARAGDFDTVELLTRLRAEELGALGVG